MTEKPLALHPPSPAIPLRPVRLSDVDALAADCWPDRPYTVLHDLVARARRMEMDRTGIGLIATTPESSTIVRGYGQVALWSTFAEITDMIVAERERNQGIGTAILQGLVREAYRLGAPAVEIGAFLHNPGAIRLYRRLGFVDNYTTLVDNGLYGAQPALYLRLEFSDESPL